ncbi:hypothetical protein OROGR_028869 [Orobanche gracilis]
MSAAILTTPSPLGPAILRRSKKKSFPLTPNIRFWLLSFKDRVSDDISEPDCSRKSLKYWDKLQAPPGQVFQGQYTFRFNGNRVNVFTHDVMNEELYNKILPSFVDVVTLFSCYLQFVQVRCLFELQNLEKVLKPNGHILPRDYAVEGLL